MVPSLGTSRNLIYIVTCIHCYKHSACTVSCSCPRNYSVNAQSQPACNVHRASFSQLPTLSNLFDSFHWLNDAVKRNSQEYYTINISGSGTLP